MSVYRAAKNIRDSRAILWMDTAFNIGGIVWPPLMTVRFIHTYMYRRTYMYVLYMYIYTYIYVCVCIHTYEGSMSAWDARNIECSC